MIQQPTTTEKSVHYKDYAKLPEAMKALQQIKKPYNLDRQIEFLRELTDRLGYEPANETQRNLLEMYQALQSTLGWCSDMIDLMTQRLLELPSNQPPASAEVHTDVAKRAVKTDQVIGYINVKIAELKQWIELTTGMEVPEEDVLEAQIEIDLLEAMRNEILQARKSEDFINRSTAREFEQEESLIDVKEVSHG